MSRHRLSQPGPGTPNALEPRLRRVVVLSPHPDDAPLSLGQSLLNGLLSQYPVTVVVLFGRTSGTRWRMARRVDRRVFGPEPSRYRFTSMWRQCEEAVAGVAFGYSRTIKTLSEAPLRPDGDKLLDTTRVLREPSELTEQIQELLRPYLRSDTLLLSPAGFGGHIDHQLVAYAAAALQNCSGANIGFYEDRPYSTDLDDAAIQAQIDHLNSELIPVIASEAATASMFRRLKLAYPSQTMAQYVAQMSAMPAVRSRERIWIPPHSLRADRN